MSAAPPATKVCNPVRHLPCREPPRVKSAVYNQNIFSLQAIHPLSSSPRGITCLFHLNAPECNSVVLFEGLTWFPERGLFAIQAKKQVAREAGGLQF